MRLATKLRDYYDGVARNTVSDKTHTFVREPYDVEGVGVEFININEVEDKDFTYRMDAELIGFCGKIYPCIRIIKSDKYYIKEDTTHYVYKWEDLIRIVPEHNIKRNVIKRYYYTSDHVKSIQNWFEFGRGRESWYYKDVYEAVNDPKLKKVFVDKGIAYFHVNRITKRGKPVLHVYPVLKDFEFYKVFDPYTCFQTIEYYLTNELVKPDEINVVISDEMKAQAHGYDKFSFRKEPTKKK